MGLNSVLFTDFLLSDLEKPVSGGQTGRLDWDEVLRDIQGKADRKLVEVELSLASRSLAPGWVNGFEQIAGQSPVLLAQGTGVIHTLTDIRFNWTLPYLAWDFPETGIKLNRPSENELQGFEKVGAILPGQPHLDFGGINPLISPHLVKTLINTLRNCASPMSYIEDIPTVQDPLAVIKQYLIFEYASSERKHNGYLNRAALEDFENKLRQTENLLNWAYYWLRDREADKQDSDASLGEFLHALRSCWNIGETFKFTLLDNEAEITNIREEAEG